MTTSRRVAAALSFILLVGLIGAPLRTAAQNASSTATHLYWSSGTTIGRATLDGATVTSSLITGASDRALSVGGINCGATCSATFPAGPVTLSAVAQFGYVFSGWSGACSGTGSCVVTLGADRDVPPVEVSATFTAVTPP